MDSQASRMPIVWLLEFLDQGYDQRSWHGPNLRGALRGVNAGRASWRPGPGRHSIAEVVLHTAYWKYTVRRRLLGQKRGSFARKGSNWFAVPDSLNEGVWKECLALLDDEHQTLRLAVNTLPPERLAEGAPGSTFDLSALIRGVAAHDLYHAGQIQLIKRLCDIATHDS